MITNNLIATNTMFRHPEIHLKTWQKKLKDKKITTQLTILSYNIIRKFIIDSRNYSSITTSTDHRLVKMKLTIPKTHQIWKQAPSKTRKLDFKHQISNFPNLLSNNFLTIKTFRNIVLKSAPKSFKKPENKPTGNKGSDIKKLKNKIKKIIKKLSNCKINKLKKSN